MPYDSDSLDAYWSAVNPRRKIPAPLRRNRTDSPNSQALSPDKSILPCTVQGSNMLRKYLKARRFSKQSNDTKLLEYSVTSTKTAYNFEPYIKSVPPLNELQKFKFECFQPKTSLKTTTISEIANDSNTESKSILPFNGSQKFTFECLQPKTSLNTPFSESSNDSKSYDKTTLPCDTLQNFERFQPKINLSSISERASSCKSDCTSILPLNKFLKLKLEIPKTNLNKKDTWNILYFENLLFKQYVSTYFESDDIFSSWNSTSKTLKKVVEIRNGKRFVRMEQDAKYNTSAAPQALQQNVSNTCIQDVVNSKYSKNNSITECANLFKSSHSTTSEICKNEEEFPEHLQYNSNISKLISNSKVAPLETYQLCLVLKDSPVSYLLESASNEFSYESEYVFDLQQRTISHPAIEDNLKKHDEFNVKTSNGTNLNNEVSAAGVLKSDDDVQKSDDDVQESDDDAPMSAGDFHESDDDECQIMKTIYDEIRHFRRVLNNLEKNSELIRNELSFPPLSLSGGVTDYPTVPKMNFNPTDFINTYGNKSFKREKHVKSIRSLSNRHFKTEMQNTTSLITKFGKESVEEKTLMWPSEKNLLFLDSILLRLQNTYQNVQREVYSWLIVHETESTGTKFQNGSLSTIEDDCLTNAKKCLMKFKDRRTSTLKEHGGRFSETGDLVSLINNEISLRTGKASSAEKQCSFSNKGINAGTSLTKYYKSVWTFSSSDSDEDESQVDNKISNNTEKLSTTVNDSLNKNSKYILKFKGRHASASRGKYRDRTSSSSDSDELVGQTENESSSQSERTSPVESCRFSNKGGKTRTSKESHYDYIKNSSDSDELNEPSLEKKDESELDDSESSLEGSFKNFRTCSRLSPISSGDDSNDSSADDVPRFSLPPPKSNAKRFYSKKTEFLDEVSCKEWSLKKGETEISLKCIRRGRQFRSDERSVRSSVLIPEEFWQDDLGIPTDLLQDFNQFTALNKNTPVIKED